MEAGVLLETDQHKITTLNGSIYLTLAWSGGVESLRILRSGMPLHMPLRKPLGVSLWGTLRRPLGSVASAYGRVSRLAWRSGAHSILLVVVRRRV